MESFAIVTDDLEAWGFEILEVCGGEGCGGRTEKRKPCFCLGKRKSTSPLALKAKMTCTALKEVEGEHMSKTFLEDLANTRDVS